MGPQASEFLKFIANEAFQKGLITSTTSMEHALGQYRWGLTQRVGVAIAHANSCLVEEVRARAIHPRANTRPLFTALQARGHKQSRGGAIPRVYTYAARTYAADHTRRLWPKNARGLGNVIEGSGAPEGRKRARSSSTV